MDNLKNLVNAIGGMAEMAAIFRAGLKHQGIPDDEALQLTQAFLHEIISLTERMEDN